MTKTKVGQWEVTMRCGVTKLVTCENCTEQQALEEPFEFAVEEIEIEQSDYEVLSVRNCE